MGNATFEFIYSATRRECNARRDGLAPLHVAAIYDNAEMVRVLIRRGAECNARTNTGRTPLHYASRHGSVSAVRALLDCGGDCNARDRSGLTPMHLTALHRHRSVAEMLVQNGANLNAKSKEKWTPLHLACQAGSADVVELLLASNADCDTANRRGWTALHVSAELGWSKIVRRLISHGVSADKRTNAGWTALHLAAQEGRLEVIQTFVELCTANRLKRGNAKGQTALHIAAMHGHERAALILISAGLSIDVADKASCTPLSLASSPDFRQRMWQFEQDRYRLQPTAPPMNPNEGISPTTSDVNVSSAGIPAENSESTILLDQSSASDREENGAGDADREAPGDQAEPESEELQPCRENGDVPSSSSRVKTSDSESPDCSSSGSHEMDPSRHIQEGENGGSPSPTDQSLANNSQGNEYRAGKSGVSNEHTEPETEEQSLPHEEEGTVTTSSSKLQTFDSSSSSSSKSYEPVFDQPHQEIVRKVSGLKRGQIIAEKFRITGPPLPAKPLVRIGEDMFTGQQVQLKFYTSADMFRNSDELHLLVRDSRYICRIIYTSSPFGDPPFIVFPKEDYTLADWMMGKKPVEERNKCLTDIAKGLRYMERARLVHCRLTPQNVVYFKNEDAWKLFNLDHSIRYKSKPTSLAVGMYSAPELMSAALEKSIDFELSSRLDAWSFGIIMYEVLTGKNFYGLETTLTGMARCLTATYIQDALRCIEEVHARKLMQNLLELNETKRPTLRAVARFFEAGFYL